MKSFTIKCQTSQVKEPKGKKVRDATDIAKSFDEISGMDKEAFFVVTLNTKMIEIDRHMISLGTLNASLVHPREVFKPAILDSAACVALVHNHPTGDTTPSKEDDATTTRLVESGRILGITVIDHVIVGSGSSFYSYQDHHKL